MHDQITVSTGNGGVEQILLFVREHLARHVRGKEFDKMILAVEEAAGNLMGHTGEGEEIRVCIGSRWGRACVDLYAKGDQYSLSEQVLDPSILKGEVGEAAQDMIRDILMRSMSDVIRYRHIHGTNHIRILEHASKQAFLIQTLGTMVLAILIGLLLSSLPCKEFNTILDTYILVPAKTMYMSALKMVVAPVVFF